MFYCQGPDYWYLNFPDCGGVMQSPINISDADALYDPNLQLFDLSDYSETDGVVMTLENVGGHTGKRIHQNNLCQLLNYFLMSNT